MPRVLHRDQGEDRLREKEKVNSPTPRFGESSLVGVDDGGII